MTRHQAVLFRQILLVFDVLVSAAAFLGALRLRSWMTTADLPALFGLVEMQPVSVADYEPLVWGLLPMWFLALQWSKTSDFRVNYSRTLARYARAVGIGLGLSVVAAFLYKVDFVARSFVVVFGVVQLASLICGRVLLLETVALLRRQHVDGHRVLIVGCGEHALAFASSLKKSSPWNNRLVGHVTVPSELGFTGAEPIVGDLSRLAAILDSEPIDEVVFAVPGYDPERFADALHACDERGVDVLLTMPSVLPPSGKVELATVTGFDLPMLGMTRVPTSQGRLLVKRLMDIVGALVGLTLAAPVLIAVVIAIKMSSPGPVFFKQVRAGRHGRKFTMFKFRSMVVDAEAQRAKLEHLNEMGGPVFKIKHDPRITKIGRIIRATSIDELPQLFNVLLGDMSLVGPRPPLPSEVCQYEPWQRRRLSVKPGLTGLWQVSGRNQVDFEQWMALDLQYIDNWSLWLDLVILLRTVPAVVRGSGAS
ncbi:MAG TPA: sugar transferase [Nannocystaceae bacterium]|nr:sugar transferase [Nannocystaceae bacterium]